MNRHSVTCNQWDVVVVPFPFTDRNATKSRPALVITNKDFNGAGRSVLAMVTSTAEQWPGDHPIASLKAAGLRVPCKVRLKLFTLENQLISRRIGSLARADRSNLSDIWSGCGLHLVDVNDSDRDEQ